MGFAFLLRSHSDNNLDELENETTKEDERAVLMEGGLIKSASTKFPSPSIRTNLIRSVYTILQVVPNESWPFFRFFIQLHWRTLCYNFLCLTSRFLTMEDSFLLENRQLLRAMWVVWWFWLCSICFFHLLMVNSFMQGWVWGNLVLFLHMWPNKFFLRLYEGAFNIRNW